MSTRRRFSGDFKAKVALEALRGDKTIQEIAARHKVHPNQVSAWKQQVVEGMKEVFTKGAERSHGDHEGEIRDLHAKIGELTVERDFWPKGSSGERGEAQGHDRARPSQPQLEPSMPPASCEPILAVPQAQGGKSGELGAEASDRRVVSEVPVLRESPDGPPSVAGRRSCGSSPSATSDVLDGLGLAGHLPSAPDHPTAS